MYYLCIILLLLNLLVMIRLRHMYRPSEPSEPPSHGLEPKGPGSSCMRNLLGWLGLGWLKHIKLPKLF